MNIAGIDYNLNQRALEVYLSGCDGLCKGCHNQKLWDFDTGYNAFGSIFNHILQKLNKDMVQYLWIMGGEPLQQDPQALWVFLDTISHYSNTFIMLWTREYEEGIPRDIKKYLKYAKVGEYREDSESYIEPLFGVELASTNQRIIRL